VNLRIGILTGRWAVELYGKNVTDEMGITSVGTANTPGTGLVDLGIIRPRIYGLSVGASF